MAKQDDGLFLLEVLIEKIVFVKSPCFSDKDFRTCVNIECPAVEPLEICDDDPGARIAKSGGPFVRTFNNGKSCLFSLKESDITKAMSSFPVKITVYKSLPCGCLPTKIVMGESSIDMTKEFVQSRKKFLADPTGVSYEALKDSFRLIAPEGVETGEIVMFIRISCFGKLIITRFQGAGGPPTLGGGAGSSIVDRSCNPHKEFQTKDDPCVCGAARGIVGSGGGISGPSGLPCTGGGVGALGVCPIARDPYNSMPCEDPDDPCYCSGQKPPDSQKMACRNTDQYCLHVPKGALPKYQDLTEDQKIEIKENTTKKPEHHSENSFIDLYKGFRPSQSFSQSSRTPTIINEYLQIFNGNVDVPMNLYENKIMNEAQSTTSFSTLRSKRRNVSFSNTVNCVSTTNSQVSCYTLKDDDSKHNIFGKKETTVYMTLFNDHCYQRTSGTQATASINKCLQVCNGRVNTHYAHSSLDDNSNYCSTSTISTCGSKNLRYSDVYFFGQKKEIPHKKPGMGSSKKAAIKSSNTSIKNEKPAAKHEKPTSKAKGSTSVQYESHNNNSSAQTRQSQGASAGTNTGKAVSIVSEKAPCPAITGTKGDMVATVSHIRIGPREPCPIHGRDLCQGPNCVLAGSGGELGPVKVTNVSNSRRGVFELVIRRMNGAPLAKNELMLEWTPPPFRQQPCVAPCFVPCSLPTPCRTSKCKMIICRPTPKPKCCKRICRKPCGIIPFTPMPCRKCCKSSYCGKPCRLCKPKHICRRPCRPCKSPPPCGSPCRPCKPSPPCGSPCRPCKPASPLGSPCLPCKQSPSCGSPCRPCKPTPPCGSPCGPCKPVCCKPHRSCKPKPSCCKTYRPCRPKPICSKRCRPCKPLPCCSKSCRPFKPCPSLPSCSSSPCKSPSLSCCKSPCSSMCLRPCTVGRKKPRKARSHPRIKTHRKRISPCYNRSLTCPVVRCQSVPGPCIECCAAYSPACIPRRCPSFYLCKPVKCCKSRCSSCCR